MGHIVINCYRPRPGKTERLVALMQRQLAELRKLGLATSRPSMQMTAADGTIIELFEYASRDAVARAEAQPDVQAMEREFHDVCERVGLRDLEETDRTVAEFEASS